VAAFFSSYGFWILAALCVAATLALMLPPLLRDRAPASGARQRDLNVAVYRDQLQEMAADRDAGLLSAEQFAAARGELESRLAEDALAAPEAQVRAAAARWPAILLAVLLPLAGFGLYAWRGTPKALDPAARVPVPTDAAMGMPAIEKMVAQAEAKLRDNPKDVDTWTMLARSYATLQRWPEAWKAYQFAAELKPDDASLLAGQAEALAVMKGGALQGEPLRLAQRALEIDPRNPKALELAAAGAFQGKDFARAASFLERLQAELDNDDPFKQEVLATLNKARQLAQGGMPAAPGAPAQPPGAAPAQPPAAAPAGAVIRGTIELAPAVAARVTPQDTIFLLARGAAGGPPVAVVRGPAGQFPLEFELSDRHAMNPNNRLSQQPAVSVVARISKSGQPKAQSGDLEGSVDAVKVGAQGVRLVIDRVVP